MSKLLRYYEKGSIYFLTVVTHQRNNILVSSYTFFKESLDKMVSKHNIELIAWVVLPDHFHILIDPNDNNPASFIHFCGRQTPSSAPVFRITKKLQLLPSFASDPFL